MKVVKRRGIWAKAIQWTGENLQEIKEFCGLRYRVGPHPAVDWVITVDGEDDYIPMCIGDWLVEEAGHMGCYADKELRALFEEVQ